MSIGMNDIEEKLYEAAWKDRKKVRITIKDEYSDWFGGKKVYEGKVFYIGGNDTDDGVPEISFVEDFGEPFAVYSADIIDDIEII